MPFDPSDTGFEVYKSSCKQACIGFPTFLPWYYLNEARKVFLMKVAVITEKERVIAQICDSHHHSTTTLFQN